MTYQSEVSPPENIEMDFPEGQFDKEIETNFPYQEEAMEQEYSRPKEKHDRDSPELRQKLIPVKWYLIFTKTS